MNIADICSQDVVSSDAQAVLRERLIPVLL